MKHIKLYGLVVATHTPFKADGSVNLAAVEKQAEHLLKNGTHLPFIYNGPQFSDRNLRWYSAS